MYQQIITAKEFSNYRDIGKKIDEPKINETIKLAQSVNLFDVLGDFYFELLDNLENPAYNDLLNGTSFTFGGGNYFQEGIKSLLSDYTYARYIYRANVNLTPFGVTQKYGENSNPVDRNLLKDIAKQTEIDSSIKFQLIDKYIKSNPIFKKYKTGNNENINTKNQRFTVIK